MERDSLQGAHLAGKKYHIYMSTVGSFQLIVLAKRAAAFQVVKPKINSSVSFLAICNPFLSVTHIHHELLSDFPLSLLVSDTLTNTSAK